MSNEVNISEVAYGTLNPGMWVELYTWTDTEQQYNDRRRKVRFFTIAPDPWIPLGEGVFIEGEPGKSDMEITRVWNTVWTSAEGKHAFQFNVRVQNVGDFTAAYHLFVAETDN